jgi:excisionase family DNA binding protein
MTLMAVTELPPPTIVWLTKREAAAHVNLSERTLDRAARAGELEYTGGGGYKILIRRDRLDEWVGRRGRRVDDGG